MDYHKNDAPWTAIQSRAAGADGDRRWHKPELGGLALLPAVRMCRHSLNMDVAPCPPYYPVSLGKCSEFIGLQGGLSLDICVDWG
jgi:hypothetical protein